MRRTGDSGTKHEVGKLRRFKGSGSNWLHISIEPAYSCNFTIFRAKFIQNGLNRRLSAIVLIISW